MLLSLAAQTEVSEGLSRSRSGAAAFTLIGPTTLADADSDDISFDCGRRTCGVRPIEFLIIQ